MKVLILVTYALLVHRFDLNLTISKIVSMLYCREMGKSSWQWMPYRKKAAGLSHQSPLYGDLFYLDQCDVDQFVNDYEKPKVLATVSSLLMKLSLNHAYFY